MRDFETLRIYDPCVKCHLQRSNAIRRPRNRKPFENQLDVNTRKRNVYIKIVNQEKERLLVVETEKQVCSRSLNKQST